MSHRRVLLILPFCLFVTGVSFAARKPTILERREVSPEGTTRVVIAKGSRLEIRVAKGEITVSRATGSEAVFSIERPQGAPAPQVKMLTHSEGVTICAFYLSPKAKKPNECSPGKSGRWAEGTTVATPALKVRIEVPDGVKLMGQMMTGDITAIAGTGDIDLDVLQGNISITDGGSPGVQAKVAFEGNIQAVISPLTRADKRYVSLEITKGELRVAVPKTLPIAYSILSQSRIDSSFDLADEEAGGRLGDLGPGGKTQLHLSLNTGLLGRLVLRPRAD